MALNQIRSREDLQDYLQVAIKLEHATIPPYLFALYSIHPGTNLDGYNIIRVVAVEEMLHMTLASNLLNAVNGIPALTDDNFVPDYPVFLPTGQTDFEVGLVKFSPAAIDTFLKIERPAQPHQQTEAFTHTEIPLSFVERTTKNETALVASKRLLPGVVLSREDGSEQHYDFYSIGEFYAAIKKGIGYLCETIGEKELFSGEASRQIGPEYYYSGGGDISVVTNKVSALAAIDLISEQGEGYNGDVTDERGEMAHYYRYQQLALGRYYQVGDSAGSPSGAPVPIDWEAVYPVQSNPKIADFGMSDEITQAARSFNSFYKEFLAELNRALNGHPDLLLPATTKMFQIKGRSQMLMRNPLPGQNEVNAGPTFQMNETL